MRQFKVTTTGTNIILNDLGITINDPTVDLDLLTGFTFTELIESEDLKTSIDVGDLTATDENSDIITEFGEINTDTKLKEHIDNISNPHNLEAAQIATNTSGQTVQDELDNITESVLSDLASVHIRRSTSLIGSSTYVDMDFDETQVENDPTVVEHNNTNIDNIDIKETGLYVIGYSIEILPTGSPSSLNGRVRINNATVIPQSQAMVEEDTEITNFNEVFIVELTAGDFVTLQIQSSVGTETIQIGTNMFVTRLRGTKGDKGDTGTPGAGSTIVLEEEDVTVLNTPHDTFNFKGNVDITDNGDGSVDINIPKGIYGSEFNLFQSLGITISSSTTPNKKIDETTSNLPIGKYRILISYGWSLNSPSEDFEVRFDFDGTRYGINNGEGANFIQTQEAKDAGGGNPDGRQTGQIYNFTKIIYVDVVSPGVKDVELWFNTDTGGIMASMWDTNIEIMRVQ